MLLRGKICLEELEHRVLLSADLSGAAAAGVELESPASTSLLAEGHQFSDFQSANPDIAPQSTLASEIDSMFEGAEDLFAGLEKIVVEPGEVFSGTGEFPAVENHGQVSPGNSPGLQVVSSFTQADDGILQIEIGGTGGAGAPNGHDKIQSTGPVTLDGTVDIDLINGFVPTVGQTFEILSWGTTRTGEFDNWLGTVGIPGQPNLAFRPIYNANNLTLQVISTPSVTGAEVFLNNGLTTLSNVANQLDSLGEFAESIPLIGDSLGNIVDIGSAVNNAIRAPLAAILAALPPQSGVTNAIQNWDGQTVGGFTIDVLGVLGNYGTVGVDPFWWEVKLELTPAPVNKVLQDVAGAVLGAVFDPNPNVSVQGSLVIDFAFGYDNASGGFFVDIDALTAKAEAHVSGISGFEFDLTPPGSPLSLNVVDGTFDLEASVTATPDASVLDANGRIRFTTLTSIFNGSIPLADAFNLDEAGTLDSSLTLAGSLTGFAFNYDGVHTVEIHMADIFAEEDPELTVKIDGALELLGQRLEGIFVIKKTATETIIEATDVSVELTAGAGPLEKQILRAENGTGKFILLDDELAGTATVTITEGPDLPNIDISGTTLSLALNTSASAVPTIDGVPVNLPAGPYYRVSGNANILLTLPEATISGNFVFEPFDPTPGVPDSGDEIVNVGVAGLTFDFNLGSADVLTVTNGTGAIVFTKDGVIAEITNATVALAVPGVTLNGNFSVELNDTNSTYSSTVNVNGTSVAVNVAGGPFLRVQAASADLEILGIELLGTFVFEQRSTSTGGEKVVTVAGSGISFDLGTEANDLVNISNGSLALILTDDGITGQGSVTLSLGVPNAGLTGTFNLRLNDRSVAVNETVVINGASTAINLPAGPYLQLSGNDVVLSLFGLSITGDYTFEQRETQDGSQIVTIEAGDVRFNFGTSVIQLTNGQALFVLVDGGMAGRGRIDVQINALGGSFAQPFTWDFNNTGQLIDELIANDAPAMGGASVQPLALNDIIEELDLPAGPYNRLSTQGPVSFSVNAGGQNQSATAELVLTLVDASPDYATVGVSSLSLNLGAGPLSIAVADGVGALVISQAGVAGKVTVGTATLNGAPGISLSATDLDVQFNNTGANVDVDVVVSEDPDVIVPVEFSGAYFHNFFAISGTAELTVGTFVTLGGNFLIQRSNVDPNTFKIGVEDLHFDLKAGSISVLRFHNGNGAFVITSGGVAGTGTLQFESGLIGISGSIAFELNSTGAAVNTTISSPSGNKTINVATPNSFKITVNGRLLLGSVSLPFNFVVQNVGGTIELRETGSNNLLVSIDSAGNISTGISFSDFASPGPLEWVAMLRQLGNWIAAFRESEMFDIEIPFTQGVTLGDAFDWSQLFLDKIFSEMTSVELQSNLLRGDGPFTGPALANAKIRLQLGSETPVEMTVSGNWHANASHDLDELAALFNAARPAALVSRLEARRNKDGMFVIALKKDDVKNGTILKIVDMDDQWETLGFGPNDGTYEVDGSDTTAEQTGVQTARYDTEGFFEALGTLLGFPVDYNPVRRSYTYTVDLTETYTLLDLPFDFDFNLGPIADGSLSGKLKIDATVGMRFTLGFDLSAREVPRILSSPLIPVPAHGRLTASANFSIFLNDSITPIDIVVPLAATTGNNNVDQLAADINAAFVGKSYQGTALNDLIIAQKAGTGLAISALQEDQNGNGVMDPGEDLNGDGNFDNVLGIINRITVRSLQNDTFATEMGFGAEPVDLDNNPATTGDRYFLQTSKSQVKGLFVEDAELTAELSITTPDKIDGTLRFGFVEISTSGGEVGTLDFNGNPNPIAATIRLVSSESGDGRFYISDLFNGLSTANIGDMIDGPNLEGSLLARLDNITVGGLGFSMPLGSNPEVSIFVPDINDLDYNPDPYDGTETGVFITYPDLGALTNFEGITFSQIVQALRVIADNLSQLSAFSFLNEPLPFVNLSVNDMLDYAAKFADLVDAAAQGGSDSLQEAIEELETQIEDLFNLNPNVLDVSLDTNGLAASPFLSGGVNNTTHAGFNFNPTGTNNGIRFASKNLATAATLNGARMTVVGSSTVTDATARASWNASKRELKIEINPGVTTANAIVAAVNGLAGSPVGASLIAADGAPNSGGGTIITSALRFQFDFTTGYANSMPFQLDLADLVGRVAGDNTAAAAFLEAATTLIQVRGSGELTVSASASLTLDFGLDLTNPRSIRPFFYDTTGVELTAKVLGRDLEIEASLGSIAGIWVKEGEVTLDADGDPETDAGDGDKGVRFRLGLKDNNGDGRHYFSENWFDSSSIDLTAEGGLSARLPVFAPFESTPLDGEDDENNDGVPDNQLYINIPDILRLFVNDKASGNSVVLKFAGVNNDILVTSTTHSNYEVELINDPSLAVPQATFSSGKLRVTFHTGVHTANQIADKINDLSTFGSTAKTATDNGVANTGAGAVHKMTIVTPDFGALFDNLDLCAVLDSQAGNLLDGLDAFLGSIEDGLNELVFSTELPLIGDGLAGAANFISDFRNGLLQELRDALDAAGGSATTAIENALKQAFWNSLGPEGLDLLVNAETGEALDPSLGFGQLDVQLDCDNGLVVNLRLKKAAALVDTTDNPIDFDIGVPGFGLEVGGNVVVEVGFDLRFGFGLNKEDGFYFNSSASGANPELRIYFEARIPGLNAKGELFFLQLDISDDPEEPSFFTGQFVVDLKDPNHDGKLTFAELTGSGTELDDIISFNLEAIADVNLDLSASFGGNTAFPRVVGEFHLDWSWDLEDGASDPEIAFTDLALDLGTFISDFLGPILKEIRKVTEPLDPIIDIVTTPLPVLSDLAGEPITLLDLAEIFGLLEPSTVEFIESVIKIIDLINSLEGIGEGSILIPFGSFSLTEDENGNRTGVSPLQNLGNIDLGEAISAASGPGVSSTYKSQTAGFAGKLDSLDNFSIPIFQNPSELFNLFVGKPVRLIEWRMPQFKFEFTYTQSIPIYPPLYAQFGGTIGATIDIGFGYDTFGIQKFIESEDKNPLDLFDGFYVIDYDASGNERPELTLYGEIFAGASINLLIAEAGVRGGIGATIDFDLNDVVDDGRVRVSEIIANAQQDPRCIFDIHGRLYLFLEAFLYIDLFFFSIDKEWRFADITLFEFTVTCPEPVLAEKSGGTLTLNVGSRASERKEIDTNDNAETFVVTHLSGDGTNETVEVQWGNWKKEFTGINKVVVEDAGKGDDVLDFRGVLATVEVNGGVGNDTIYLGDGANSKAWGGDGNDTIVAGGGSGAVLYGDAGNDVITANAVSIEIHGGAGNDTINGSPQGDTIFGDAGSDTIAGHAGNDEIEGGDDNDVIEGDDGADTINGGKGADKIWGSLGDDLLNGGDGSDEIFGGSGNDFLVGGSGNDKIYGHGGIDLIIGDNYGTVNGGAINAGNVSAILAAIPNSGVSVGGLTGKGNDFLIGGGNYDVIFGGDGDDFLYGGNFFANGDTEVIEEDHNDFFDGGTGNDRIFGDDALGRTGDRDTGIAVKSSVFFDLNNNGLRDEGEVGFAGITVELRKQSDDTLIDSVLTKGDGSFEFVGLDPLVYYLKFSIPGGSGLAYTTKWAGMATKPEESDDDSDVNSGTGRTDQFYVGFDTTMEAVTAGFTGPAKVSVTDISMTESNSGQVAAVFTLTLSGPQLKRVEIDFATANGSATVGSGDYESISGMLIFNPGEITKTVTVMVNGDTMYEEHEQFELKITRAERMDSIPFALQVTDPQILATIVNDDRVPEISIADYVPPSIDHDNNPLTPMIADEGRTAEFIVRLSNPSHYPVKVQYRVDAALDFQGLEVENAARPFPLYAMADADFIMPAPGTITFAPGETQKVIKVQTIDDALDELEEHFFVDLFSPEYAKIADSRAYGIIPDDDQPVSVHIVPSIPAGGPFRTVVTEGNSGATNVEFKVWISAPSGRDVAVTWATSPGTAVEAVPTGSSNSVDYVGAPNSTTPESLKTLIFKPGEPLFKTVTLQVLGDTRDELDEEFFVNLISADGADIARGAPAQSNHITVVIQDDDGAVPVAGDPWSIYFGETTYNVDEPSSGSVFVELIVRRTPGSPHPVAVIYTVDGSATAPGDYNELFREVIYFAPGEISRKVKVEIKADAVTEGLETFHVYLKNPTGGPVKAEPDHAIVRIHDNDLPSMVIVPPVVSLFPLIFGIEEKSSGALSNRAFLVQLSSPAGPGGVQVNYETVSLTARSPQDFTATSGVLNIAPGATQGLINIPVREDTIPELSETFAVRLKNPAGATLAKEDSVAIATIFDDDLTPVSGEVFYDSNGNGFKDFSEKGIKDVDVEISWFKNGVKQTTTATTNASGIYSANVLLGQVTISVKGDTVTSPYGGLFTLFSGEYELTTGNESQTVDYEGIVGISPFEDVGYRNTFTFSLPQGSKDVGRGGTDDTIYGGPGNDEIDAGAGDDFVVGGHWMTATDGNAPINLGTYDAKIKATTAGLHSVHDGTIFSVDTAGINAGASISGQIWRDANLNNTQDGTDPLFTLDEVIVNLYDGAGNHVNSVVTTNGLYTFNGLYLKGLAFSNYVVEFILPDGWALASPNVGGETVDSDAVNGGRTALIGLNILSPTATQVDAGLKPSDAMPSSGSGKFEFDDPSYTVSENEPGYVDVVVVRGNSQQGRSVVVRTFDGSGPDAATAGTNYVKTSRIVYFDVGETFKVVRIPILDTDSIGFTDTLHFFVELRTPTGRLLDKSTIYIYGDGAGTITDDDNIQGGNDWDIIIGDSGNIPATVDVENSASWNTIVSAGGPGKDIIDAGDGADFVDGQLGDDTLAGGPGLDEVRGGMGDDTITAELDIDTINGQHGYDVVISDRDVPLIELISLTSTTATLFHRKANGELLSTFNLSNIEEARLFGGYQSNRFNIENWDYAAMISGGGGSDTLIAQNDATMLLKDANIIEQLLYEIFFGFAKDASISMPEDITYQLASLENVTLKGSSGANVLDASGYSRSVTFQGLGGNDTLIGGSAGDVFEFDTSIFLGTDTITGNGGIDTLDFSKAVTPVTVNLATLSPTVQVANANALIRLVDKLEKVVGGSGNDTLTGNDLDNILIGGPGDDSLAGGAGSETYVFDTDTAFGVETITENISDPGVDILDFSGTKTRSINVNLGVLNINQVVNANLTLRFVGEGIEVVLGGEKDDVIRGNASNNILRGGLGNDVLDGKSGDDQLDGGLGNDDLDGGTGNDFIQESANANFVLTDSKLERSNGETDKLKNVERADLTGGPSANTFTLTGWTGAGTVRGGGNFDTIIVAADLDMALGDSFIEIGAQVINLQSIEAAVLSGGPSANLIDAILFTGIAQLNGGDGDDVLFGGRGPDVIDGGLGNDTLTGYLGNDTISGGGGTDTLVETRDVYRFVVSNTKLVVDRTLAGVDEETDTLSSIEAVELNGGPAANIFDVSAWSAGAVTVRGGGGIDIVSATVSGLVTLTNAAVNMSGSGGTITLDSIEAAILAGGAGDDTLNASAFSGIVSLRGGAGNDRLVASRGLSQLLGEAGDDTFVILEDGIANVVQILGGEGKDAVDLSDFFSDVTLNLGVIGVAQNVVAGELQIIVAAEDLENLVGGSGNDTLTGNNLSNEMTGGPGNDNLNGAAGSDRLVERADSNMTLTNVSLTIGAEVDTLAGFESATLIGGAGNNTINAGAFSGALLLDGGAGNDTLTGGTGSDVLIGGAGDDTLQGGGGNDIYRFNADSPLGSDTISELAAGGSDTLDFSATLSSGVSIDLGLTVAQVVNPRLSITFSAAQVENVIGTDLADTLRGNGLDNIMLGRAGNDVITAGAGLDTLFEGRDADFVLTDTTLTIGSETDTISGFEDAWITGGAGNNTIDASAFTGSVSLIGLAGNDVLIGGSGDDVLNGGQGNDELFGNAGNDDLTGGDGDDRLNGGGAAPGLTDDDHLRGNAGNDTYIFDLSQETGTDRVYELANQGYNDVLQGAGLSGIAIDLSLAGPQTMDPFDITPDSFVILQNPGQVENSY